MSRWVDLDGAGIYKWIRGDGLPSIDNLVILADILGMKIDDIVVTRRV